MFTPAVRFLYCAAGLFLFLSGFTLSGQDGSQDLQKVRQESIASFESDDFRTAISGFRMLMEREPNNAMHSYYTGRCLVELNEQLEEAIELLYGASNGGVPNDVNFYLGMAYQRSYNFTDALKYFGRFELVATRQQLKEYKLKRVMETCRSAREIIKTYNPFEVMNVTFIDLFDSLQFSQVKMKGGHLQRKPAIYFRDNEEQNGITSLMFIPPNTIRGDYIYYSGYSRSGKEGAQLFRVKRGGGGSWSDPEEINMLNTEGDDVMPYFDPIEDDLYFASNGRLGIGGFDLYKSHFDTERDQWSEPLNLGFPVNSAMDEFLLLPGSDLGMIMFFSNRQGTDSTITVYRVHLIEPKKNTEVNDYLTLSEIANLGGAARNILNELETLESAKQPFADKEMLVKRQQANDTGGPEITQVTILSETSSVSDYQLTLSEALSHQAVSDSLKDLASAARVKVRESDDPNDRWVWQKQIMLWEKKANDEEELADALYVQMEKERNLQEQTALEKTPEVIQIDTVINEITVYRYTMPSPGLDVQANAPPEESYAPPAQAITTSYQTNTGNSFDILNQSPYGGANPIPMDVVLTQGILYRIQLGAFNSEVEPDAFRGISPVTGERIPDRGIIKYYAGKFSSYDAASMALPRVRSDGYEDAFIVAWYNGNPISTQKAKQLE